MSKQPTSLQKVSIMIRWYLLEMYIWWIIKSTMLVTRWYRLRYPEMQIFEDYKERE